MSRPASTTSAPSGTNAGISSRSDARNANRRPSSGPPAAPPAGSGTDTPSPTATGNTPSPQPSGEARGIRGRLRAAWENGFRKVSGEILLLRSLLPPAAPDLSPKAVGSWPLLCAESRSRGGPFPAAGDFPAHPEAAPSRPNRDPFVLALSLFPYEGAVGEGIRAAKYGGRSDLAPILARRLFEAIRGDWADRLPADFRPTIVPVPLRPGKYFTRGYNLPALVAFPLGRLAGWPCDPLLLRRVGERRPQAGLPLSAREENVRGAFAARTGVRVPSSILLVDDVYTSGATAAACARALKKGGAELIVVLTVASAVL